MSISKFLNISSIFTFQQKFSKKLKKTFFSFLKTYSEINLNISIQWIRKVTIYVKKLTIPYFSKLTLTYQLVNTHSCLHII